jgi:hypothetical protein
MACSLLVPRLVAIEPVRRQSEQGDEAQDEQRPG